MAFYTEESVSRPCKSKNELNGERAAPISRSNWTRAATIKLQHQHHEYSWYYGSLGLHRPQLGNFPEAAQSNFPLSTITPPNSCTMSTDKLSSWVNCNVYTVRKDIDKIRCCKSIISDQRNLMFVSNFSYFFNIWNVDNWITARFQSKQAWYCWKRRTKTT